MKKITVSHFILGALLLALTVQVFNTSNLYISISNLPDPHRVIGGYFIGLSAEFAIFICIYAGSRSAGAWFAVITFLLGILYHDHWDEVYISFEERYFHFPKPFLSSTLLQFMNSVLVWFLSELYIKKQTAAERVQTLAEINRQVAEAKQELAGLIESAAESNRKHDLFLIQKETVRKDFDTMNRELLQWNNKLAEIKAEIQKMQKVKGGLSRHAAAE